MERGFYLFQSVLFCSLPECAVFLGLCLGDGALREEEVNTCLGPPDDTSWVLFTEAVEENIPSVWRKLA